MIIRDYVIIHKDRELELPSIITNGESKALSASEICFFDEPAPSYGIALILSIDLEDQEVRYKAYLIDGTTATYVSVNNIYITGVNYSNIYLNWIDWWWEEETIIHKISIDQGSITYKARGDVSGWVLNQFSMDEFKGYFRIATTIGHAWAGRTSESNVYVMNGNLEIIGELTGLGKGEEIYSARFMATRCYLVTFEKIDPFYVIDLSDQTNPTVLGELKLPGYSDYLHPYDVNYVIGLGKDAIDMGEFSWFQGVKLSLFDVTDLANPIEISNYSIGDRGTTSEALYTHKAFLFSKSKDLLVIPIRLYEIDESKYPGEIPPNAYGDFIWQGAYVFSVTTDDGFVLKGRISHLDHFPDFEENPHKYAKYFVKRSLYIEDEILTVSEKMVKIHQLDTLAHVKTVEL